MILFTHQPLDPFPCTDANKTFSVYADPIFTRDIPLFFFFFWLMSVGGKHQSILEVTGMACNPRVIDDRSIDRSHAPFWAFSRTSGEGD